MNIATEIKNQRTALGLTQEQLAAKILVSSKTISNWETGKTTPDIDNLIRLKNILNLSLDNLLLEGSDLVENIKKYAQLKLYRSYCLLSYAAFIGLFLLMSNISFSKISTSIIYALAFLASGTLMIIFSTESDKLKKQLSSEEKKADKKTHILFSALTIIFALVIVLGFCFNVIIPILSNIK